MPKNYSCPCIVINVLALSRGLSAFSGPSRAALILKIRAHDTPRLYDPKGLLAGNEEKISHFMRSADLKKQGCKNKWISNLDFCALNDLKLPGTVSFGCSMKHVAMQYWVVERQSDLCSTGPIIRWMEFAAGQLALDLIDHDTLREDISNFALQSYSTHAVRDYATDLREQKLGMDSDLQFYPILDAITGIANTREEGAWARGSVAFVEPKLINKVDFIASFPAHEQPNLANFRHCRKLVQAVEGSTRLLISDGSTIVGISQNTPPPGSVIAHFKGRHGFMHLDDELICAFSESGFFGTNRKPKLELLEGLLSSFNLPEPMLTPLLSHSQHIVECAQGRKHGCTLVLDLGDPPTHIAGLSLNAPLDLKILEHLALAASFSKLDGALHINKHGKLLSFACLLDGPSLPGENRGRGARYNSALRFSAHHPDIVVVVVSSDRPISIMYKGAEFNASNKWTELSYRPVNLNAPGAD